MEVKVLKEKVQKAAEKVEKCKSTIERHHKSLEKKIAVLVKAGYSREVIENNIDSIKWPTNTPQTHYWEACEVEMKRSDIKGATKKLKEAETILSNWEEKLDKEEEKDNFVNNKAPKVIVEFLEEWKKMAFDWHVKRCEEVIKYKKELTKEVEKANAELESSGLRWRELEEALNKRDLGWKDVERKIARKAGSAFVLELLSFRNEADRLERLEKVLEQDKKNKLIDLVNRINEVVGEITDAKGLSIQGGNLNGIIIGKKGKAKVETIGAGGWNIQVFHYRTLVHEIKGGK